MISNAYANKILDHLCGNSVYLSQPDKLFLGLCSTEPDRSTGSVQNAGEPTSQYYDRLEVGGLNAKSCFSKAKDGKISNPDEIKFKTAREPFGTMKYFFLSQSVDGPAIMWGDINGGDGVVIGDLEHPESFVHTVPTFYEGELTISLDVPLTEGE